MPLTTDSLVHTKLQPSQARPKLVARPRLIAKLEREVGRKLTLISAPAGFGKTTLLVEWLRERAGGERSVAWLSLDEGDNDPVRFLSYLVAALGRTVGGEFGEGVLAALRSPEPPRMEAVLGTLINELADLPGEAAVVLDDYHVIDSEPVHGILSFVLEHLPPNVHLLISSRVDPPLQLSRLRARDQMLRLDATDLSFTSEEAATFLNRLMGLNLSADDVAALEERTEGWIAGLQLAALSMRDRKDVSGFIKAFSGSHRDVLDYLAEEVLRGQPERVQEFLLETSILDHLTGALCDALTSSSDGQEMLERLEKDNLFVVALDDERRWYRYHHLFADFLRARLHTERPERIKELHCRAAAWFGRSGLTSEAVGHALAAEDYEWAADLVERVIGEMWFRGEVQTLLGWLEALPEGAKRHRPRLLLEHATALMWVGRLEGVESLVREAERIVDAAEGSGEGPPSNVEDIHRRYLLGYAAATRAWHANLLGNPRDAIEIARRALELLPDDPRPRTFAAFSLAAAYSSAGDLEAASAAFAEAAELGLAARHDYLALEAMGYHAELQITRGRLRGAEGILRRALEFAAQRGDVSLPATGEVQVAAGKLLYEWDDLDSAEDRLTEGVRLTERTGQPSSLVDGYVSLSRLKQAQGEIDGAFEAAWEAERLARSSGVGQFIVEVAAWKSRLHLAQGELAAATSELERVSVGDGHPTFVREIEQVARARLLVAKGEHHEALRLLTDLREAAQAAGRTGREIEILTLQALTLQAMGEKERAVNTLRQALALGEPEGYVRTFVDEGPKIAALISEMLEAHWRGQSYPPNRVSAHYLRKLRAALEQGASDLTSRDAELPEPLSERELEVLTLIAAGKTNQEIAGELFVAKSTVKTHIKNIYHKLDVRSRTQALARARELGLI